MCKYRSLFISSYQRRYKAYHISEDKFPFIGLYITSHQRMARRMGSLWGFRLLGRCPADVILSVLITLELGV